MAKKQHNKQVAPSSASGPVPLPKTPVSVVTANLMSPDMEAVTDAVAVYEPTLNNQDEHTPTITPVPVPVMWESPSTPTQDSVVVAPTVDQPLTPPLTPNMKPAHASSTASPPTGSAIISLIASTLPTPIRSEAEKLTQVVVAKRDSVLETAVGTVSAVRDTAVNRVVAVRDHAVNTVVNVKDSAVNQIVTARSEAVNKVVSVCDGALGTVHSVKDSAMMTISDARNSVSAMVWSYPMVASVVERATSLITQASKVSNDTTNYFTEKGQDAMNLAHTSLVTPVINKVNLVKCKAAQVQSTATTFTHDRITDATNAAANVKSTAVEYSTPMVMHAQKIVNIGKVMIMPMMTSITGLALQGLDQVYPYWNRIQDQVTGVPAMVMTTAETIGSVLKAQVGTWADKIKTSWARVSSEMTIQTGRASSAAIEVAGDASRSVEWVMTVVQTHPVMKLVLEQLGVSTDGRMDHHVKAKME